MKRVFRLGAGFLALFAGALLAVAEGPDDLFIRVYNLIQQADTLRAGGQQQDARAKYLEARAVLDQLETSYPNWNPKIVNYRRSYITEHLGAEVPSAPLPAPAAATAAGQQLKTEPKSDDRLVALMEEVNSLRTERDNLQAKLREALTVQPAAVDPRELSGAERRLQESRRENESLKANLAEQQAKLARAADPTAYAEAQKALKEANESLKRQTQSVTALTKERDSLRQQLRRAGDKAQARAARDQAKAAKSDSAATSKVANEWKAKADELGAKLMQAQDALVAEQRRSEMLMAERSTLEKRVTELSSPKTAAPLVAVAPVPTTTPGTAANSPAVVTPSPTPAPVPAPAPTPPPPSKPASAREAKAEKATEKAWLRQLERERDELRKRVAVLTREVEDRKLRSGSAQQDRLAEELAILRARIQVYEARQIPYTPEELALIKQTAATATRSETTTPKRSARQVPAGAAALVAEAQRAFQGRRLDEAEKKYQQALILDEKNVGLLTDLTATYLEQGQLEAADATLKRATAQDPNDPEVLALMGLLRFRQAKYDEALDTLSRAAQYNPDNALTQNYLGVTLIQKGQRGPAERAFRKAIQLEPNYADAHFNLALVYAQQKPPFFELARWHYQKALAGGHHQDAEIEKLLDSTASPAPSK